MIWFIYFIIWLFKIFFDTMWWRPHLYSLRNTFWVGIMGRDILSHVFQNSKKHFLSGDHGERYSLPCFSKFKTCQLFFFFVVLKFFFLNVCRMMGWEYKFSIYIKLCEKNPRMKNTHSFWVHHNLENVRERSMVL